jgi:hypothetical protein
MFQKEDSLSWHRVLGYKCQYLYNVDQFIQWADGPVEGEVRVDGEDAAARSYVHDEVTPVKHDNKSTQFPYRIPDHRDNGGLRSFPCVTIFGRSVIPHEGIGEAH